MSKLPTPLRLLFVICAGIGTLYLTSQWAMGKRESRAGVDELVTKTTPRETATAESAGKPSTTQPPEPDSLPSRIDRSKSIPGSKGDPFAHLSWLPPAPPPPPPPPPAAAPKPVAPVVPPLPFTFVGMLERGAQTPQAFLARGETLLVVSAGDTLDNNTYRVESLNANEIVMTYLPMNVRQALSVSGRTK
jgi:hypothetical protein